MGVFPNLSRNVPFCPRLSSFVLLGARNGDKSGQKRTNGDKTGHFGTNWETPPYSIYPHLALLKLEKAVAVFGVYSGVPEENSGKIPGVWWPLAALREAKPGGFQTRVFPTFFGKGPDCVADPFGTVPRRCS